ncbi:MAG: alanyl-tRNA editing protein AlaXM [Nitrososphaeria archaeon]
MTELLYQKDSYLREFEATIIFVEGNNIVLDRTAFHPITGGVGCDIGLLRCSSGAYKVLQVLEDKPTGNVLHTVDGVPSVKIGEKVNGIIDWGRRYRLMRLHTAAHILSSILYRRHGAYVTGGHIDAEHGREDFGLESSDKSVFEDAIAETNSVIDRGVDVKVYFMSREDALKIPGVVKLAERAPPNLTLLRIVEIPGVDIQADGGPHVMNTKEIGGIVLEKVENKGKGRKRVYYRLSQ